MYTQDAYAIIVITITSRIILKNKYYKHNYISLIFFVLITISIDLFFTFIYEIKSSFELIQFILFTIILPIIQSILYVYEKYMIENLFYSQWTICFSQGIMQLIFNGSIHIYILTKIKQKEKRKLFDLASEYYLFFEMTKVVDIIIPYIISIIIQFILNLFLYLTLYNFQVNYLYICKVLSNVSSVFLSHKNEDNTKFFFIVFFAFQVFFFLTYLEIIELKFCGLDKNTRRNIQIRERKEILIEREDIDENERFSGILPDYTVSSDYNEKLEDDIIIINNDNGLELQKTTN
jgi:hypothetical protein